MMLNKKSGFTLIELLVAMAIIGILATLAMAGVRYARERAMIVKAEHTISTINNAISIMANDTNEWPGHQPVDSVCSGACGGNEICGPDSDGDNCANNLNSGVAGITADDTAGTPYSNWSGPYIIEVPLDPWGYEYFFDTDYDVTIDGDPCSGAGACISATVIGSYGPDNEGLNEYNSDDIIKIIAK